MLQIKNVKEMFTVYIIDNVGYIKFSCIFRL